MQLKGTLAPNDRSSSGVNTHDLSAGGTRLTDALGGMSGTCSVQLFFLVGLFGLFPQGSPKSPPKIPHLRSPPPLTESQPWSSRADN